jgi:uncharacterized protein
MAATKDFSVEERLISLVKVQKIDSKIDEINKLRGELPMEVKDLEDEIEGLNTRKIGLDEEINGINQFITDMKELQRTSGELLKKYEKQQGNVKNSREFEAINKEIELQDLEIKACDKKIRDANNDIKGIELKIEDTNVKLEAKQDVLKGKQIELEKIIAETEKEEAGLLSESNTAKQHVEARLLTAYERIRKNYRNGLSVVSVDRNSCGGCFNIIPPQRQAEIRLRKKIIVCEHCGRVLVDAELYHGEQN